MGSGKTKKHEHFTVAPATQVDDDVDTLVVDPTPADTLPLDVAATDAAAADTTNPLDLPDAADGLTPTTVTPVSPIDAYLAQVKQINQVAETYFAQTLQGTPDPDAVQAYYDDLTARTQAVYDAIDAQSYGALTSEEYLQVRKALGAANAQALGHLEGDDLRGLATVHGFQAAALVSDDSLRFHLNPAYGDSDVKKQKVQAAALARLEALQSGGTYNGMTLADYNAANAAVAGSGWAVPDAPPVAPAAPADLPDGAWTATAESAQAAYVAVLKPLGLVQDDEVTPKSWMYGGPVSAEDYMASFDAMRTLSQAQPGDGITADELASMRSDAMMRLANNFNYVTDRDAAAAALQQRLGLSDEQSTYLLPREMVGYADATTGDPLATIQQRSDWIAQYPALVATTQQYVTGKHYSQTVTLPNLEGPDSDSVAAASAGLQALQQARATMASEDAPPWNIPAMRAAVEASGSPFGGASHVTPSGDKSLKEWAAGQDLKSLRAVAADLGLQDADAANRSQITNYLRSVGTGMVDADQVQTAVTASIEKKAAVKAAKAAQKQAMKEYLAQVQADPGGAAQAQAQTAAAKGVTAAGDPALKAFAAGLTKKSGVPDMTPPTPGSFTQKTALIAGFAQHTAASLSVIPPRMSDADLASVPFSPAPNPGGIGGAHTKSFVTDGSGQVWMLKPYSNSPGGSKARATAEATASRVLAAGGVPAVPVYATSATGSFGALQPLVKATGTMSKDPGTYSQADVDAVVRMHVGTWLVGDHDLHPGNVLRTAGGGLVPIDQGQAFKNFGVDRLAMDYHPNKAYGEAPPVWQSTYQAARSGALAPGVHVRPEVAAAVISAYEKIPDADYREMLRPVAKSGAVSSETAWLKPMRAAAAKTLGKPESDVTAAEIEETFLDHAVSRKRSLRRDFMKFFVAEGWTHARTVLSA